VETAIEADAGGLAVPPLILQPLVENAVRHGVSTRLEGGTVRVEARRAGSRVLVIVTNPCDLEGRRKGTGFGLDIVRRRLAAAFGPEGALAVEERDGGYRAAVTMPAREMDEEGRNRPAEVRPT
jgi:LytS/YehU family sensor histidine kinase